MDFLVAAILHLERKALTRHLADPQHAANPSQGRHGDVGQKDQFVAFPPCQSAIVKRDIRTGLQPRGSRQGLADHRARGRLINLCRQRSHDHGERRVQVATIGSQFRLLPTIHAVLPALHTPQHPVRVSMKILVNMDGFAFGHRQRPTHHPSRSDWLFTRQPLSEEDDVGCDLRVGVLLECRTRQPHGPDEISLVRQNLTQPRLALVESAAGGDEGDETARPHPRQCGDKKVIVDAETPRVESRIVWTVIAERDV